MAIDTRNKRSSAILPGIPWRNRYPDPDGTIGASDRLHAAWLYEGIAVGGAVAEVAGPSLDLTIPYGRMHLTVPFGRMHLTVPRLKP